MEETQLQVRDKEVAVLTEVAMQREIAEVQAAMTIAKRFPRDHLHAIDRITIVCQRPALAEGALYTYSRGGTEVTGPSIRLAEAIAQQWGNMQFGIRELEQRLSESTVEAYAWDLETNVRENKVFQVKHTRHTKKGSYLLKDPRDIYEMVANQGARRLRACILGVIPGDVVEAAVNQCEVTLKAKADTSPEALQKMVVVFGEIGVSREMLEQRIQRKLESITPAQVIGLRKIYNSIKDGMSKPSDWFEMEPPSEPEGKKTAQTDLKKPTTQTSQNPPGEKKDPPPTTTQGPSPDLTITASSGSQGVKKGSSLTLPQVMEACQKQVHVELPVTIVTSKDINIGQWMDRFFFNDEPHLVFEMRPDLAEVAQGLTQAEIARSFKEGGFGIRFQDPGTERAGDEDLPPGAGSEFAPPTVPPEQAQAKGAGGAGAANGRKGPAKALF